LLCSKISQKVSHNTDFSDFHAYHNKELQKFEKDIENNPSFHYQSQ